MVNNRHPDDVAAEQDELAEAKTEGWLPWLQLEQRRTALIKERERSNHQIAVRLGFDGLNHLHEVQAQLAG